MPDVERALVRTRPGGHRRAARYALGQPIPNATGRPGSVGGGYQHVEGVLSPAECATLERQSMRLRCPEKL